MPPDDVPAETATETAKGIDLERLQYAMTPTPSPVEIDSVLLARHRHAKTFGNLWYEIARTIAIAGGLYPIVFATIWIVFATGYLLLYEAYYDAGEVLTSIFSLPILGPITFVVGFLYAGLACVPALSLVALALRMLNWQNRWDQLGLFCGGLVAYLCTLGWGLSLFDNWQSFNGQLFNWQWLLGYIAMVPGLAIFVGQVGGASGGLRVHRQLLRQKPDNYPPTHKLQFSLWQLMALMAVISVLLTILRALGLLTVPMFLATGVWLILQVVGRRPAMWVAKRLELRRLKRIKARRYKWQIHRAHRLRSLEK